MDSVSAYAKRWIWQFLALSKKNFLLAYRNLRATFLQLFVSFFFCLAILIVDVGLQANQSSNTNFRDLPNPSSTKIGGIPLCIIKTGNTECFTLGWQYNHTDAAGLAKVQSIVANIQSNNDPVIPASQVKYFETSKAMDEWLLDNTEKLQVGVLFNQITASAPNSITFVLQINSTVNAVRGFFTDPNQAIILPTQNAVQREISRYLALSLGKSGFEWNVDLKEFPHPALQTFSTVGTIGPLFFFSALLFSFVIQISSLVAERELKLRQAMRTFGLPDSVFWCSWFSYSIFLNFWSSLFLSIFGCIFQFKLFLKNEFGTHLLLFFLFQNSMTALAFCLSTFVRSTSTATSIGFVFFIVFFIFWFVVALFGFPYGLYSAIPPFDPRSIQIAFSFLPPNLLTKGLNDLGALTATDSSEGIKWSNIQDYCFDRALCDPNFSLRRIYEWLIGLFFLYGGLTLYFDNVVPDPQGVRKPLYYFLMPSYWGFGDTPHVLNPKVYEASTDPDVIAEENSVKEHVSQKLVPDNCAIQVQNLVCLFESGLVCPRQFLAVKGPWFEVQKNSLFSLLGPNGAGKSTTINMLTGVIPAHEGDAMVLGRSIRSSSGMNYIRSKMGVCPQFDLLWDLLTAEEHLELFGRIKGIPEESLAKEVQTRLEQVRLTDSAKSVSSSFSGGMKRRLSVAISFIGDPELVFLDEPTTGMDPISRRQVWKIIEEAKAGRAIVLTTHSMEESDFLSDRISIMARGRMRCIGSSISLKSRFGAGIRVSITCASGRYDQAVAFFQTSLAVGPETVAPSGITFIIPQDRNPALPDFFARLSKQQDSLGITELHLGICSLEDVFLNIARIAEAEHAAAANLTTQFEFEGTLLNIPVGAVSVSVQLPGQPPCNLDVKWGQVHIFFALFCPALFFAVLLFYSASGRPRFAHHFICQARRQHGACTPGRYVNTRVYPSSQVTVWPFASSPLLWRYNCLYPTAPVPAEK
jgi:ABC-type multidrug transport system ATPase subunit